jgi:hypothetical protein
LRRSGSLDAFDFVGDPLLERFFPDFFFLVVFLPPGY